MKFGQNPTIRDMAKVVDDRLGRTTGASKGKTPEQLDDFFRTYANV